MNDIELIKHYAFEVWEESDKTTKLLFSDETDRLGDCFYSKSEHLVHICPAYIYVRHNKAFSESIDLKTFTKWIVAHELGHSLDTSPAYLDVTRKLAHTVFSGNEDAIDAMRPLVFKAKFAQEIYAWKKARQFVPIENKNVFYAVVCDCLNSYIKNENNDFESLVQSFKSCESLPLIDKIYSEMRAKDYA